jgi:23S rRNA (adenine-N6)-dimethyltransferase
MSAQRELSHSQNFIRKSELVNDLLGITNINTEDLVIEIGPGKGIITRELVKRANQVIVVEKDSRFIADLSVHNSQDNLQVVNSDFLEWQLPRGKYKVFSNIPFNYTADIINKLTSASNLPTDIYLIMQEAAAFRFAGQPYQDNSLASTLIGIDFTVEVMRKISRESFEPRPNVEIVFVHFAKHQTPRMLSEERQLFRDFVVYGYTKWTPSVLESFKEVFTNRQRSIIGKSQKLIGVKPTELTTDQWIGLFKTFRQYVSEDKKDLVHGGEERLKQKQSKLEKSYRTREKRMIQ